MKGFLFILFAIFLLPSFVWAFGNEDVKERVRIGELYSQDQRLEYLKSNIYVQENGEAPPQNKKELRHRFQNLSKKQKELIHRVAKRFDGVIPEYFMTPLLYWRFMNPNAKKVSHTLEAYFLSRYLLIRETALIHDLFRNSPQKAKEWYKLTAKAFPELDINTSKIENSLNGLILKKEQLDMLKFRAQTLSEISQHETFIQSLKETPSLVENDYFKKDDKHKVTKLVDALGPLPGNTFEFCETNGQKLKLKKNIRRAIKENDNIKILSSQKIWNFFSKKDQNFIKRHVKKSKLQITPLPKDRPDHISPAVATFYIPKGKSYIYWQRSTQKIPNSPIFFISGPASDLYGHQIFQNFRDKKKSRETASFSSFTKESLTRGEHILRLVSTKNQKFHLIHLIDQATKSIYINAEQLYHPQLVNTLIRKKLKEPSLDVRVLLHVSPDKEPNALPSSLFIERLKKADIEVVAHIKRKKALNAEFITIDHETTYYPVCGFIPYCANELPAGHMGITLFHREKSQKLEESFQKVWRNPKATRRFNLEDFRATSEKGQLTHKGTRIFNHSMGMFLNAWKNIGFHF